MILNSIELLTENPTTLVVGGSGEHKEIMINLLSIRIKSVKVIVTTKSENFQKRIQCLIGIIWRKKLWKV